MSQQKIGFSIKLYISSRRVDYFRKSPDFKSVSPKQILIQHFCGVLKNKNSKPKVLAISQEKMFKIKMSIKIKSIYYFPQILQEENKAFPS